ncbi:gamma subclass chorismate mutase AroQ [Horticoccus sp. 23ND18S-11]|uniref:gamma subclass chorismate mutase AroQ n=1 Tax=Horticoccus sp. 23ND18S-11 TaxID=3391832 RepID=UPI0039C9B0FE
MALEPLLDLMAQRLALMPDVARHKWNTATAIEDLPREQQIIDGLKQQAEALGVPAAWAERFFRAQIEAAKVIQREQFARWQAAGQGRWADAPDLATVIRPRLDALTPRLLRELALTWPALSDPAQHARLTAATTRLESGTTSAAAARAAAEPLTGGSSSTQGR